MANYNGFLVPTANSPPVYAPSVSSNAAPNSFMPVYAPNIPSNSVPQSFMSGYAPHVAADAFTPVYSPSMSTSNFSFTEALHNMNWNDPMYHASPNTAEWLQAQRTSVLPGTSMGSLPVLPGTSMDSLPVLPHPTQPLPILPYPTTEGTSDKSIDPSTEPGVEAVTAESIAPKPKKPKAAPKPKAATKAKARVGKCTASQPSGEPTSAKSSPSSNAAPGSASLTSDSANTGGRTSKRVPIKSRRNELADAIGTDVGLSAGAQPSLKRPAQNKPASAGASKYVTQLVSGFCIY